MSFGPIQVNSTGVLTEPTKIVVTVGSVMSAPITCGWGTFHFATDHATKSILAANGVDFQYHLLDGVGYLTGPRAPQTAPTVASTGARATAVLTTTGAFANGETITIGWGGERVVRFVTTVDTTLEVDQVLLTGAASTELDNLKALVNNTGQNGVNYYNWILGKYGTQYDYWFYGYTPDGLTVSAKNATTITFQAVTYGTRGNTFHSTETCANASFAGTTFSGGGAGTGTDPAAGTYEYGYLFGRKADGFLSAISPITELVTGANANVSVSAMETLVSRDATDFWRIMRTTTDVALEYKVGDATSSPFTDSSSDTALLAALNYIYDEDIVRPYAAGYPQRYRAHVLKDGAVVGTGARRAPRQTGTVSITNGTYTATFGGALCPNVQWIGRYLRVLASARKYLIVDVSSTTFTLSEAFGETTVASVDCEVTDDRDPFEMLWGVPKLLNNWPQQNSDVGTYSDEAEGNTAIAQAWDSVILWTMTGVARAFGDADAGFRFTPQINGAGAFSSNSVVEAEGVLYWIGPNGVYGWGGVGDPVLLSRPKVSGEEPRGIAGTIARINPLASTNIVSIYQPDSRVVRWWVPVDSSIFNNLVIVLDLQTGGFTFENCDGISSVALATTADGKRVVQAGDIYGKVWQLDNGYSDGVYGIECKQTVSSYAASTNTITVTGTPFPTANGGLAGAPVMHVIVATGEVQRATVGSNTSSALSLVGALATAPVATDIVVVGAIVWRMTTSWFSSQTPDMDKTISSIVAQFLTTTAGQLWMAVGYDGNNPSVKQLLAGTADYADLTRVAGAYNFVINKGPGKKLKIDMLCFAPGFDFALVGLVPTFRVHDEVVR